MNDDAPLPTAHALADSVADAVADAHRREWGVVLAATARVVGDFDLAEEAVQDAYAKALATWSTRGIPENTGAWLTTVAKRRALDLSRRAGAVRRALPRLAGTDETYEHPQLSSDAEVSRDGTDAFPDDRLRLIFTCCHPALAPEAQVALTLRLICGISTADVARAFLVAEATMAARLTRAKQKISRARIPYRVPSPDDFAERLDAVLTVVELVYTTGHTAPSGTELVRTEMARRGRDLAEMLRVLLPKEPDVAGLLALILLTDARRAARVDPTGRAVLLADQDRRLWDRGDIARGVDLLREALSAEGANRGAGEYTIMAAIAAVHDEGESWEATDWAQILALYDVLASRWPSPVVALNRAIARGFAHGPADGLADLDRLLAEPRLARYGYLEAARAEFLERLGRVADARLAYDEAMLFTGNDAERALLEAKRSRLGG